MKQLGVQMEDVTSGLECSGLQSKAQANKGMLYDSFTLVISSQVLLVSFMQIAPLTSAAIFTWLL